MSGKQRFDVPFLHSKNLRYAFQPSQQPTIEPTPLIMKLAKKLAPSASAAHQKT